MNEAPGTEVRIWQRLETYLFKCYRTLEIHRHELVPALRLRRLNSMWLYRIELVETLHFLSLMLHCGLHGAIWQSDEEL